MAKTNSRGWFVGGGYHIYPGGFDSPPRTGVRWSPAEDYDLWLSHETGAKFDVLCKDHGRDSETISQRLHKYEYGISGCSLGALVFLYVCCRQKPHFRKMADPKYGSRWVVGSKDGLLTGAHRGRLWELVQFWNHYCYVNTREWDYKYYGSGTHSNQPQCSALKRERLKTARNAVIYGKF